jgi:DNA-binding NarL/FixJ family response regulator
MAEIAPRIVLVEGEPLTRSSLRRLLEDAGFDVRAETGDAENAIEFCLRERPELCLVALGAPRGRMRVVREVSQRVPEARVVVLSPTEDPNDMIDAIRAGASGYLLKSMDPNRIPYALHGVLAGEAAIPRLLVTQLVSDLQTLGKHRSIAGRNGGTRLTSREWEILELLCAGISGPGIAERLMLSPVTVRRHCAEAVRKLGVRDRDEAIALLQNGS